MLEQAHHGDGAVVIAGTVAEAEAVAIEGEKGDEHHGGNEGFGGGQRLLHVQLMVAHQRVAAPPAAELQHALVGQAGE